MLYKSRDWLSANQGPVCLVRLHPPALCRYLRFVGLAFTLEKLGNTDNLELELSDIQVLDVVCHCH